MATPLSLFSLLTCFKNSAKYSGAGSALVSARTFLIATSLPLWLFVTVDAFLTLNRGNETLSFGLGGFGFLAMDQAVLFIRTTPNDHQVRIRHRSLQRLGFIPLRAHPYAHYGLRVVK
jgi:hypothetical protein